MESASRRGFLKAGALACVAGSASSLLTPRQAYAAKADHAVLTESEVFALENLSEAIVPGSTEAGISYYIDSQLAVPAAQSLLMLKFLAPPPFEGFYQSALASVGAALATVDTPDKSAMQNLVGQIATDKLPDWQGPPASLFYFVLRSDAVDVVYGSQSGSEKIGIPYRAHIAPKMRW